MRKICLLLLFIMTPLSLSAQHALQIEGYQYQPDKTFSFDIGLETGALFGTIGEWVFFDKNGDGSFSFVESRLDWQCNPLFYTGLAGSVEFLPRFFIGFGFWLGGPRLLGFMGERGW